MTESKYIESTNLCKLRIVKIILADCFRTEEYGIKEDESLSVIIKINEWISELEKRQNDRN